MALKAVRRRYAGRPCRSRCRSKGRSRRSRRSSGRPRRTASRARSPMRVCRGLINEWMTQLERCIVQTCAGILPPLRSDIVLVCSGNLFSTHSTHILRLSTRDAEELLRLVLLSFVMSMEERIQLRVRRRRWPSRFCRAYVGINNSDVVRIEWDRNSLPRWCGVLGAGVWCARSTLRRHVSQKVGSS